MSVERYASVENLTPIFTKIETKLQNRYTKAEADSAISNAIAGVTQFDYQIVTELPASGTKGVIYLVPNSGSTGNIYDEYIWIVVSSEGHWEKFGTKELDVSGKLENSDVKVNTSRLSKTNDGSGNGFTIDLSSGVQTTLSEVADKLENTDAKVDGTYVTKTNDGSGNGFTIGLSSAAQTSLGKADTAVQPAAIAGFLEGTDVKVDSTYLTKTADQSGNGFTISFASAVQTALTDAGTALQPEDIDEMSSDDVNDLLALFADDE